MTDKQIIEGIDVRECQHYGKCSTYCYAVDEPCSDNPNCYYRQLQRKEQECEELKKELMKKDEVNTFFNTPIEGWSNDPCGICELKQILAEIKEICNSVENIENINSLYDAKLSGMYLQAHKILQKISECEVKNE